LVEEVAMSKKVRDSGIHLRVAGTLRAALEEAASADDRSLSDIVRAALIDFATRRITERAGADIGTG
jgi:uncharacterized protein (DUF1778 family)